MRRHAYWPILLSFILAMVLGSWGHPFFLTLANIFSELFVRLLKLISLPIISFSLLVTLSSLGDNTLSRVGKNIVFYTVLTTVIATVVALVLFSVIQPVVAPAPVEGGAHTILPSYVDNLVKVIPDNFLKPFLEGNVVSIILLSLLVGFGITTLPKAQRLPIHQLLQSLFQIMMQITRWVVRLMPFAMWGFLTTFIVELKNGLPLHELGGYLLTIVLANLFQACVVLPLLLFRYRIPLRAAFVKMLPALSFAFFAKSSSAALPAAIECAESALKVKPHVARFSFPLCTSINMNACAAFIFITVLFVATHHGVSFSMGDKCLWVMIATVAAIGNAGVPMGCFFITSALLSTMDLPLTMMGVILPFYALLDMLESAINVWSDACVTLIVNEKEKEYVQSDLTLDEVSSA